MLMCCEAAPIMAASELGRGTVRAGLAPTSHAELNQALGVLSRMNDDQVEELLEGVEIAVAVQERMTFAEAERRDETIDGLANSPPLRSQQTVVGRRVRRQDDSSGFEDLKPLQLPEHPRRFAVGWNALKNLTHHQIEQTESLLRRLVVEPIGLRRSHAVEVVDPDGRVDDDHRLPTHGIAAQAALVQVTAPRHLSA